MKLLSKKRIAASTPHGAPVCGFVIYVDPTQPILLQRRGLEVANDIHDDFYDTVSHDNGRTWSEPRLSLQNRVEKTGATYFVENTAFYSADHNRIVHLVDEVFQASLEEYSFDHSNKIRSTVAEPQAFIEGNAEPTLITNFGIKQGIDVSFCHPVEDSKGRLLVPVQWQREDINGDISSQGFPLRSDLPHILNDVWQCALLIGTWANDYTLNWQLGNAVPYDFLATSRGLCEGTVNELADGRLVMVLRGSNAAWPEKPGYKWIAFSDDGGVNWSHVEPLKCDDDTLLESSATGSALLRSEKNGKLYWIGNLCFNAERANGNWPRSPLYIAEVQEEPFALIRKSITSIDQHTAQETELVQHSNFRFYQDRETGDIVLYLTRFGERGHEQEKWINADLYEYHIGIDL